MKTGYVTLIGTVYDQADKLLADSVSRRTFGVIRVYNELKTRDELKKAAEKSPSDLGAVRAWARAVFASGDGVEAEKILAGALDRNPLESSLLLDIADLKKAAGNTAENNNTLAKLNATSTNPTRGRSMATTSRWDRGRVFRREYTTWLMHVCISFGRLPRSKSMVNLLLKRIQPTARHPPNLSQNSPMAHCLFSAGFATQVHSA